MEQALIELLDIRNVSQLKKNNTQIDIYFTAEGTNYLMTMKKKKGKYEAWAVWHENRHDCSLCNVEEKPITCRRLDKHRDALFHRLVEHPSIRLEWLYLPYKEV